MKIFYFDLETTGTNPAENGIHQISGMIEIDGVVKEEFDFHVKPSPNAVIVDTALQVAGVTREQIMSYPEMGIVYGQLIGILLKYVNKFDRNDKFFLCGYNNSAFDNQFLREFFLQNADRYFGSWFWSNSIDVMVLATVFLLAKRPAMENFKLSTVAATVGVEVKTDKLHDAMYDIYLTQAIYKRVSHLFFPNLSQKTDSSGSTSKTD